MCIRDRFWRFWSQTAIRVGSWKYLKAGADREYLFNMDTDTPETENLLQSNPQVASDMREQLQEWLGELQRPDTSNLTLNNQEKAWYEHYFDPAN